MYQLAFVYLACILAGFALTIVPTSTVISAGIASFLGLVGGIAIVVFAIALLILGVKVLIDKCR